MAETPATDRSELETFDPPRRSVIQALSQALDFPERAAQLLLTTLTDSAIGQLTQGQAFVIRGFGAFECKSYRQVNPRAKASNYGWDPCEVPYPGPISFTPADGLLRQLDTKTVNQGAMYNCDPMLEALQQQTGVPRAQAAQVMRLVLMTLVDLLIEDKVLPLPGLGTLINSPKPTRLHVDVENERVTPLIGRTIRFSPSPALLKDLPNQSRTLAWAVATDITPNFMAMLGTETEE